MAFPADPARIDLRSTIEVYYWCLRLHCSETRLRNAIRAVGPGADEVQTYLNR